MEDSETELTLSESDTLAIGADFFTVELETQPMTTEYVVKWAEEGSKLTLSSVKKEADEGSGLTTELVKIEADEAFFQYEEVYPDVAEHSVEVKTDWDEEDSTEPGSNQLVGDDDVSDSSNEKGGYNSEGRQYRCHYCGKCYSHPSSLSRHLQKHTGKAPISPTRPKQPEPVEGSAFQCTHCGLSFKGSRSLGVHKKLHLGKRLFPCNICGKDFNHSSSLSRHRLIHKKGNNISRVLQDMSQLRHPTNNGTPAKKSKKKKKKMQQQRQQQQPPPPQQQQQQQHHYQGGETFYACTQCEMTFKSSTALSKHQVSHVRELLTNYTQGTDDLTKSSDLKIRLKLCSRDKPNFYTLCKKNKRSRAGKRAAAASEEEEGLFGCTQCNKRFSHSSSLARHEQMHKGENKFSCSYCRKTFKRLAKLHQHEKTHTPGKNYECTACNKTFVHSSSYSRHKKAHEDMERVSTLHQRKRGPIDEMAPLESDTE